MILSRLASADVVGNAAPGCNGNLLKSAPLGFSGFASRKNPPKPAPESIPESRKKRRSKELFCFSAFFNQ
jgi:hypothetical protein